MDNDRLDEIFVNKIKAYGYHGVFEKENREGQWFYVDLRLMLSLEKAAQTDDLAATVDYSQATAIAKECIAQRPPFQLIEKLAGTIADKILAAFPAIQKIEVTVHKPQAPVDADFSDLGVRLTRTR